MPRPAEPATVVNVEPESRCLVLNGPGLMAVFSCPVGVLPLEGLDSGDLAAPPGRDAVRRCGCMAVYGGHGRPESREATGYGKGKACGYRWTNTILRGQQSRIRSAVEGEWMGGTRRVSR